MYRRLLTAASAASLTLALVAGAAGAQASPPGGSVGTPGEPRCHGERVSGGSQITVDLSFLGLDADYRLTPKNRAALLEVFEGGEWTVREYHDRVRERCEAPGNAVEAHAEGTSDE